MSMKIAAVLVLLASALCFVAQDAGLPYRKAGTWQETMFASREAMHNPNDPLAGVIVGVWEASGPYQGGAQGFSSAFPPEQGGPDVKWTARREWNDGDDHGMRLPEQSAFYLRRGIYSKTARSITVTFGSKDGLIVWINGERIHNKDVARALAADQETLKLPLRKGDNVLLVKMWNGTGQRAGFNFKLPRPIEVQIANRQAIDRLWEKLAADFSDARSQMEMKREQKDGIWAEDWPAGAARTLANRYADATRGRFAKEARDLAAGVKQFSGIASVRVPYDRARNLEEVREILATTNPEAVRGALEDLTKSFGKRYAKGPEYLRNLAALEKPFQEARSASTNDDAIERLGGEVRKYEALSREALLANPMLDVDKVLVTRRDFGITARQVMSKPLGMPLGNSWTNDDIAHTGWDNEIALLSKLRGQGNLRTFHKPDGGKIVSDVEIDFDASKVMFSSIGSSDRWRLFEIKADGTGLRQMTPDVPDVDHFDSTYLPNGKIAFMSTAGYQGMPCIAGTAPMAQMYTSGADGENIRQITFEQDSDWTPSVLNDGRLMYLRWEYADLPHYFSRILFASNPDGTGAREYFHSNSYFPNAFFYARAIPGHPTQVVGIVSGHHGLSRTGRMLIVDPEIGRAEADGVVQEIPGHGKKVAALIKDSLIDGVWPQFLHPYPLADFSDPAHPVNGGKYYLAAMKRDPNALWGIYLVDVFDNLTLVKEVEGAALLEPILLQAAPRPPVIPDRIKPGEKEATVYMSDIYHGPGLTGIPRGAVKSLRLFAYHFNYNTSGGHDSVGVQSGWDIKRILGTVPVEEDGSASFKIPANTPVTVQPLDSEGRALQLMRSWFVGMPGEVVSCVGCHDRLNSTPPSRTNVASRRTPSAIKPWYGPARPIAYRTEIQPVLDRNCVSCHDGRPAPNGRTMPNFRGDAKPAFFTDDQPYLALQQYIHRYGPEPDAHILQPMEYHTSTSPLFQILAKGHHGVSLDAESRDRLITWVDLNAPWRGSWAPNGDIDGTLPRFRDQDQFARRRELAMKYANVDTDPEREFAETVARVAQRGKQAPAPPGAPPSAAPPAPKLSGWPFEPAEAQRKQEVAGFPVKRSLDLGGGQKIELVLVPAGSFVMGDANGEPDEYPQTAVRIDKPFYMGRIEVSNSQYNRFDPNHDSRYVDQQSKDHFVPGYTANRPEQPAIRVSWQQAMAFCKWLSDLTGERVSLPTESRWEWAARAGSSGPFWFGGIDADFGQFANLADKQIKRFDSRYAGGKLYNHFAYVSTVDDGEMISAPGGKYKLNPWGLADVIGNVAEWTLSTSKPYPYDGNDGRDDPKTQGRKVVRGGSWRDRPFQARSAYRLAYEPHQPVFDVGFRVVVEAEPARQAAVRKAR